MLFRPGYYSPSTAITKEETCVGADEYCFGKPDGTTCNYGIWCDEEGKKCGGQSCVGMDIGICASNICTNPQKTVESSSLAVPSLPDVKWVIETTNETVQIYCLGASICTKDNKPLVLSGKTYTYTRSFKTNEDRQKDTFTLLPFSVKLEEFGWKNSINTGDYTLSIGHGDGPFDSTGGVLAYNGSAVRAVIESMSSAVQSGSYPDVVCPCQITNKVFISDEVNIRNAVLQQSR